MSGWVEWEWEQRETVRERKRERARVLLASGFLFWGELYALAHFQNALD
jgi:hypothetical protein